jgi:Zn-dependent peptidase ImmA (M78 family)/transcriptional regulator with XRE-family HTH domain
MKSGTTGFHGERLVEAREARQLTGVALSALIGVARSTVSQYEKNVQTPRPEVMQRVVSATNLPIEFFLREPTEPRSGVFNYRSMSAATKSARLSAERRHEWFRDTTDWLQEMVTFPKINVPDLNPPPDPKIINSELIERAAIAARRFWSLGDGPILNVTWFLENRGILISLSDFGSEELDAFSESGNKAFEPFVSLGEDKRLAARSNFTASHELGHLLIHRNVPENVAMRSVEHKLMEQQADHFAGCFLLPATTFASRVRHPSLDLFRTLKAQWRVSIGAMMMRTRSLGLIDEEQHRRIWIAYSKRGWRTGEPMDDELGQIRPRVVKNAFELLLNERIVSKQHIRASLPYAPSDIEDLCGLGRGFLSDDDTSNEGGNLVRLPSVRAGTARATPGDVVQFDRKKDQGHVSGPGVRRDG